MKHLVWLDYEILGNTLLTWVISAGVFFGTWMFLIVARRLIQGYLRGFVTDRAVIPLRFAAHVIGQTKGWFLLLLALFAASHFWESTPSIETTTNRIATIALLLQMGIWTTAVVSEFLRMRRERQVTEDREAVAAMDILGFVLRVGVWTVVLLLVLDSLGINITALVAGLGVGGIAVALSLQNLLNDLFASLSIVLDKPFVVGDFLVIDNCMGSVERVGIKTTRLRSLSGEQLIFSNNDLLSSRIRNYGRMFERRVEFSLGVTYQTSIDKLRRIPTIIREAIESQDRVRFDRAHFQSYGDFALIFEAVYYVLSPDYNVHMDIQQSINLTIYDRFAAEGVKFAYPTQTLYLDRAGRP